MLEIKRKRNIYITRGDSAYLTIAITDQNKKPYTLSEGDVIKGEVRTHPNNGELIFEMTIDQTDPNNIVWHILPENTKGLEVGKYSYDIEVDTPQGDIFTFLSGNFIVTDETTYKGGGNE